MVVALLGVLIVMNILGAADVLNALSNLRNVEVANDVADITVLGLLRLTKVGCRLCCHFWSGGLAMAVCTFDVVVVLIVVMLEAPICKMLLDLVDVLNILGIVFVQDHLIVFINMTTGGSAKDSASFAKWDLLRFRRRVESRNVGSIVTIGVID